MSGIGVILNPHSRSNRQNPERLTRLGFIIGDKGALKSTQDISDLPTIMHEFKERQIDILAISGGDGTNHCTLTTLINEYGDTPLPKIAFLRGGTMNAIAESLHIYGSPEQILSNLIFKYHEDQPFEVEEVDVMNINGKYGFLFGNGLIVRFLEIYYKNKGGPLDALWLFVRVVAGVIFNTKRSQMLVERFDAEVIAGGEKWGFKNFSFIDAGTIEDFCFGFKPLYRARSKPGCFQIMGCSGTARQILSTFPSIFMGRKMPRRLYEDSLVSEAEIHLERPQTYMIDGDIQDATDYIKIKTGPRLKVIVR